jgi:cytochrome c2
MGSKTVTAGLFLAMMVAASASAQEGDLAEGKKLYDKQCAVCHGNLTQAPTGDRAPAESQWRLAHADIARAHGATMNDVPIAPLWGAGTAVTTERLAVVPLYGPQLRGVIGRSAGIVEGYQYSETFLKKMNGAMWDEASMNKWITSSQTMVPGTYMFYTQKNPDVRRKIIDYLKANP